MYWNSADGADFRAVLGLIVTWDVLKLENKLNNLYFFWRLIVTWDVLKHFDQALQYCRKKINSNMRCIETCPTPPALSFYSD